MICKTCWYYGQWFRNNGDNQSDWYYFCNITEEEFPEKIVCENGLRNGRLK